MATRRSKAAEDEKLDAATLERVIALLEPSDPSVKAITKKDACSILNISYNTTRLGTLIEKYKEKKAQAEAKRAALRGKPASPAEVAFVIQEYLEGASVAALSERTYRPSGFIARILEEYSVPTRAKAYNYFKPELIPEGAMRDRFKVGEVVYSARYDSIARIDSELKQGDQWVYRIWLISDKWQQFAYQEAAELASLEHLVKLGVTLK